VVRAAILSAILVATGVAASQETGVLRITATLLDAAQAPLPVAKHALLISENPPTRAPRRIVTGADGSFVLNLAPGSYLVESDRPVVFLGQSYQWTAIVEVVSGRETTLALSNQNAEVVAAGAPDTAALPGDATAKPDDSSLLRKWQASLVTIWSPTSQATGVVVDAKGLLVTDRNAVGSASTVEVQLSPTVKVPARVLAAESTHGVAVVWVDPSVLGTAAPLPLPCPAAGSPSIDDGASVVALTASPRGTGDVVPGEISGFRPRGIETNLRVASGEAGGPVFASNRETMVGLTAIAPDQAGSRRVDVLVIRAGMVCEAVAAARSKMSATAPLAPTPLPVEPMRTYPTESMTTAAKTTSSVAPPRTLSSSEFDVALVTPRDVLRARERADWTGGRSGRPPEAEARLGRLTDFGSWSQYFADVPPLLIVRVTPKLTEGLWLRVAREAARTQGADLPAFKDFRTNFLRLRVTCGGAEVPPIHPFVIEHAVTETKIIREGLYVFGPDALGPHCGNVTLTVSSEQVPEKAETVTIAPAIVDQIWQDFAPYRAAGK
jgi:S1-C subfamily serine protease